MKRFSSVITILTLLIIPLISSVFAESPKKIPSNSQEKSQAYDPIIQKLESLNYEPNEINTDIADNKSLPKPFKSDIWKVKNPKQVAVENVASPNKVETKATSISQEKSTAEQIAVENVASQSKETEVEEKYWKNGKKKSEKHFKDGLKDGLWTIWYENGRKEFEENYKNGLEDGLMTFWYEGGQKKEELHWKDGKLNGLATEWYENGKLKSATHYKDGVEDWTENKQENYWEEMEGQEEKRKADGLATQWDENGKLKFTTHYIDGKLNGLATEWYENGKKKIETHYKDGLKDGLMTFWYENGQKEFEWHYKDGKLEGLSTDWYENGKLKSATHYKDGVEDWTENKQKNYREEMGGQEEERKEEEEKKARLAKAKQESIDNYLKLQNMETMTCYDPERGLLKYSHDGENLYGEGIKMNSSSVAEFFSINVERVKGKNIYLVEMMGTRSFINFDTKQISRANGTTLYCN